MPKLLSSRSTLLVAALLGCLSAHGRAASPPPPEPNLEMAKQWWPDLTDYWTPVGWKHHRFRYNVFFDGTIYADPALSQTAAEWAGQGLQLRVQPLPADNEAPIERMRAQRYTLEDDRRSRQGWTSDAAPVLWTEWTPDGLRLRESVFAHTPGGNDVKTGTEPLFAWVRLSVEETMPGLPLPERYVIALQFNAPRVRTSMNVRQNITMAEGRGAYPRVLRADGAGYDPTKGLRVIEPDGKVRLAIAPGATATARFLEADDKTKDALLVITLEAKQGRFVDVLVPMVPTERAIADRELNAGYDQALAEANAYWAQRPATAATIDVPEDYIGDTIHQFERFAQVLSEREPETGRNVTLSGSLAYVKIWATPTGKMVSMFLDPLGYHELAGEFLEPFIEAQGTRKPPSEFLPLHAGYLGSPAKFKSIDWMADHGSLLFALANHALLSSDAQVKKRYAEVVVKACEFIRDARRAKGHGGVEGILPPARYSDAREETQGVWSDGWNFKGLSTGARLLRQIQHPRAAEFTAEAADYQRTYMAAFRAATAQAATWTDEDGKTYPFVPTSLHGAVPEVSRHPFYLDTGPMNLVFAGLLNAEDPLMQASLKWFRDGPVQRFARPEGNFRQVAFLRHEMSSCIPGYSWNVFHNHQLRDRQHYLEGMYSQFAGAISRQTRTVCETRGGITGRITHADTPFFLARLAVVDDVIADNELHLLRICPLAWISAERESKFENMPTAFGPVTLRWKLSSDGKTLALTYTNAFHTKPGRVRLHVPPLSGLETISVNGKNQRATPGAELGL